MWEGHAIGLHWLPDDTVPVPVWIAAEGPRTQRLAGRLRRRRDVVELPDEGTARRCDGEHRSPGPRKSGGSVDDIEIWHMCNLIFAPTEDEGIDLIPSVLAGTANHVFRFTLEGKGLPPDMQARIRGLMSEYQSRHHAQPGQQNPNNELVDKWGLREYLARQGTIAGPPERCVERLHEVADHGVRNIIVSQFVSDQRQWMRTFADEVLPAFR